jgi:hypothetical protein
VAKKKKNIRRRKNKTSQSPEETVNMINTIQSEYDHLLAPPFLRRMTLAYRRSSIPLVKIFYDIGSGVNIMFKVTYEYLFGNESLYLTYIQL